MDSFDDFSDSYEWQEDIDYSFYQTFNGVPTQFCLRDIFHDNGLSNPVCHVIPPSPNQFRICSGMLQHFPNFHGVEGENPYAHVEMFLEVVGYLLDMNQWEEEARMRLFAYSLQGNARYWLDHVPSQSIYSWDHLQQTFCEEFDLKLPYLDGWTLPFPTILVKKILTFPIIRVVIPLLAR